MKIEELWNPDESGNCLIILNLQSSIYNFQYSIIYECKKHINLASVADG